MSALTLATKWGKRIYLPFTPFSYLAKANSQRGLVISNREMGTFQLYAWDVPGGRLTRITNLPKGTISGLISADGKYIFYLDDQTGCDQGHLVRIPFEGGTPPVALTPELPPYVLRGLETSRTGNKLAFTPINREGFQFYIIEISEAGEFGPSRRVTLSSVPIWEAKLSHNGELAAFISMASPGDSQQYSVMIHDTSTSELIGKLCHKNGSIEVVTFSPIPGDMRLLVSTSASGLRRPLIWNPVNNEQTPFNLPNLDGELVPLDWSPDGRHILLNQFNQAIQTLYTYDLQTKQLRKLNHPKGVYGVMRGIMGGVAYYASQTEFFTHWQDAASPMSIISLDAKNGEKVRDLVMVEEIPPAITKNNR